MFPGKWYDEVRIGERFGTRVTVTETHLVLGAGMFGDFNPLHVDEEFCRQSLFGGRVAHGPLILSTAIGLMSQLNWIDGTAMGLLGISWKFLGPVKLGDTIAARVTPLEARPSKKSDRGVLTLGFEVLNQREEVVETGSIVLLMKRRPAPAR